MRIGERLAAQQREQQAQASEWEKRREAGRAWAYQRAGLPVPDGDATDAPREATRTAVPDGWEDRRAKGRTHEQEGADTVTIPVRPSPGILMSMAIRSDHALGMPGFYDQPFNARDGITHAQRLAAALTEMRQVYEEVARRGFYRDEREGHYTAMVGGAPAVMSTQGITHAPEPAVIARTMAIYRLACAAETAANAIASLTDRVAALEAANARREREAAPRPFSAD